MARATISVVSTPKFEIGFTLSPYELQHLNVILHDNAHIAALDSLRKLVHKAEMALGFESDELIQTHGRQIEE